MDMLPVWQEMEALRLRQQAREDDTANGLADFVAHFAKSSHPQHESSRMLPIQSILSSPIDVGYLSNPIPLHLRPDGFGRHRFNPIHPWQSSKSTFPCEPLTPDNPERRWNPTKRLSTTDELWRNNGLFPRPGFRTFDENEWGISPSLSCQWDQFQHQENEVWRLLKESLDELLDRRISLSRSTGKGSFTVPSTVSITPRDPFSIFLENGLQWRNSHGDGISYTKFDRLDLLHFDSIERETVLLHTMVHSKPIPTTLDVSYDNGNWKADAKLSQWQHSATISLPCGKVTFAGSFAHSHPGFDHHPDCPSCVWSLNNSLIDYGRVEAYFATESRLSVSKVGALYDRREHTFGVYGKWKGRLTKGRHMRDGWDPVIDVKAGKTFGDSGSWWASLKSWVVY